MKSGDEFGGLPRLLDQRGALALIKFEFYRTCIRGGQGFMGIHKAW
jgi:hypothetical protein